MGAQKPGFSEDTSLRADSRKNPVSGVGVHKLKRTRQCRLPTPKSSIMEDTALPFPYPKIIDRPFLI